MNNNTDIIVTTKKTYFLVCKYFEEDVFLNDNNILEIIINIKDFKTTDSDV